MSVTPGLMSGHVVDERVPEPVRGLGKEGLLMRIGWCSDICATAKPIWMRSVLAASAAANVTGST